MSVLTRRQVLGAGVVFGLAAMSARSASAAAKGGDGLSFVTHAEYFSDETHQPKPLDPQMFVGDAAAVAGNGPQGIAHVSGFRPAFFQGAGEEDAYNAQGKSMGFKIKDWFAAKGSVRITPEASGARLDCSFTNLLPNGVYSLFENHFDQTPTGFTPLDGKGAANSFTADAKGSARISLTAPAALTHANAVLLVYHSDGKTHGDQRGEIGVTAHHQLIAGIPA